MDITEATFRLMDVIYIVVGVGSGLAFYWKMVLSDKSQESKIGQMKKDIDKKMIKICKNLSFSFISFFIDIVII